MAELLEELRRPIDAMCRKHNVRRLELFGSAAKGTWNAEKSDLDFLVEFLPAEPGQHADAYFGLLFDLEDFFQRKVDLVETPAISNPYFLSSVNQCRKVLYAA